MISKTAGPFHFLFLYPLLPWFGVMLLGYGASVLFEREAVARDRALLRWGLGITASFIVLRLVDAYGSQVEQMQREYQSLLDARLKLQAKLTTIKQERQELEALLELAKAKEITAKTMKSLDDLSGVGDADVARIADSIRARLDRASAEGEMRAASLDKQMDEVLGRSELDAQLVARKARLGLASQAGG